MNPTRKTATNWLSAIGYRLILGALISVFSASTYAVDCKVNDSDTRNEYAGGCVNGFAHGKGIAKGRDTYEGEFKQGNKHGKGTYTSSSGVKYDGEWLDDLPNGEGTQIGADGSKYVGTWLKNQRSGMGENTWPNGQKYRGKYHQNQRNGKGIYYWPDGIVYEGDFISDKRSGFGTMTVPRIAYKTEARSKLGSWNGEIFVEKGYFDDGKLQFLCASSQNCKQEQAKREAQERREAADREASNRQACSRLYIGKPVSWPEGRSCVLTGCDNFTLRGQIVGVGNGVASAKVTESYKYGQVHEKACNEF